MAHHLNMFQWIVAPFLFLLSLHSFVSMARGIHRYSAGVRAMLWLVAAAAVLWPELTIAIAKSVGIGRGTDLVLYLFIIGCLAVAFYFYGRIVRLEMEITALVRQSALRDSTQAKS